MPPKYKQSDAYSEIFNRLIELCERNNTSVTAIAKELTTSTSKLDTWKKGNINTNIIPKLVLRLNTSLDYLFTGKEKILSSKQLSEDEQKILKYFKELSLEKQQQLIGIIEEFASACKRQNLKPIITKITRIKLPVADFAAGAGVSLPLEIDDKFTTQEFNYDDVPDSADCGVPINGISMEPDYPDGSIVWVQRRRDIRDGDVVIVIINGEPLCKIFENKIYYSINEEAGFPPRKPNKYDKVVILGKVVGVYNEEADI